MYDKELSLLICFVIRGKSNTFLLIANKKKQFFCIWLHFFISCVSWDSRKRPVYRMFHAALLWKIRMRFPYLIGQV